MDDLKKIVNEIYEDRKRIYKKYGKENRMKERLKSPVFWTQFVLLVHFVENGKASYLHKAEVPCFHKVRRACV